MVKLASDAWKDRKPNQNPPSYRGGWGQLNPEEPKSAQVMRYRLRDEHNRGGFWALRGRHELAEAIKNFTPPDGVQMKPVDFDSLDSMLLFICFAEQVASHQAAHKAALGIRARHEASEETRWHKRKESAQGA